MSSTDDKSTYLYSVNADC